MDEYTSRINRVIDYIENHLSEKLTLEGLSGIAFFSPYHFHRLFSSFTGETLYQFILRHRLEKAATLLIQNRKLSLTNIALECGFANSSSFSKSFKSSFNKSPSMYRKDNSNFRQVESNIRKVSSSDKGYLKYSDRSQIWNNGGSEERLVEIKDYPETYLAYIRHIGPYKGNASLFQNLWNRLSRWAAPRDFLKREGVRFLALYHNGSNLTEEPKLRVSIAISVPEETKGNNEVGIMSMESGRYACIPFVLGSKDYQEAWNWVYGTWLPQSGFIPGDGLAYEEFFYEEERDLPPGKHRVSICLPVKPM